MVAIVLDGAAVRRLRRRPGGRGGARGGGGFKAGGGGVAAAIIPSAGAVRSPRRVQTGEEGSEEVAGLGEGGPEGQERQAGLGGQADPEGLVGQEEAVPGGAEGGIFVGVEGEQEEILGFNRGRSKLKTLISSFHPFIIPSNICF